MFGTLQNKKDLSFRQLEKRAKFNKNIQAIDQLYAEDTEIYADGMSL